MQPTLCPVSLLYAGISPFHSFAPTPACTGTLTIPLFSFSERISFAVLQHRSLYPPFSQGYFLATGRRLSDRSGIAPHVSAPGRGQELSERSIPVIPSPRLLPGRPPQPPDPVGSPLLKFCKGCILQTKARSHRYSSGSSPNYLSATGGRSPLFHPPALACVSVLPAHPLRHGPSPQPRTDRLQLTSARRALFSRVSAPLRVPIPSPSTLNLPLTAGDLCDPPIRTLQMLVATRIPLTRHSPERG